MVERWRALSARERFLALLALLCAAGALLWVYVLEPAMQGRAATERRLTERRALLDWLERGAAEARVLRASGAVPAARGGAGMARIEAGLGAAGLRRSVAYLAPAPSGAVEIRLEDVSWRALGDWLDGAALRVETASVEPLGAPDRVNARLTVTAP